ncbi:hypothetical protein PINS_up014698 [Pythium insidiosum]|nr:hypothetical protein PINS_up014698 [Pythium insidiosum]
MNQLWLEQQQQEDIERRKQQEVQTKLASWSVNRMRNESEALRRREAAQLAAGLDKYCQQDYDLRHPRRRHLESKRQEWQELQQSAPRPATVSGHPLTPDDRDASSTLASSPALGKPDNPGLTVVVKKKKPVAAPGTPLGSGGMHFRNHLPANFTPQGRRSGSNSNSSSTPNSKDSRSTPSTPMSSSSSGKLMLLDELAAGDRSLQHADSSQSLGTDSLALTDDRGDLTRHAAAQPRPKFSERNQDGEPEFRLQPFFPATITQHGGALTRALSASILKVRNITRNVLHHRVVRTD